jgi:hypothetical protein
MYINTKILKQHNLNLQQVSLLQILHQNKTEDMSELLESYNGDLDVLNEKGLLSEVKAKSKQESVYKRLRLSKKGSELLEDLSTPEVLEEDKKVFEWLKNYYLKADKEIGNGAKTLRHIRDFRTKSGIQKNNLITLVLEFLKENEERSKKLEYIWYYPKTAFATRFDLEESWLWNFYQKNKERLDAKFEKYE